MSDEFATRFAEQLSPMYEFERELGGGGMSRVFVARELALGRRVVLKALAPEMAAGVSAERFRREIAVAAGLMHPHIVPVHQASQTADGVLYYSMPFIEGHSLRARLEAGPIPLTEAVRVLRDVASALAHAHRNDLVHRDMKPENVLLSGAFALVADFGIAKALRSAAGAGASGAPALHTLTNAGVAIGTPEYMAPEQAAGDVNIDARADLYSLGVIAYELVSGASPFAGLTPRAMMVAHLVERPKPITDVVPRLPATLATVIMQCLEKEPVNRPDSAAAVGVVLEAFLSSDEARSLDAIAAAAPLPRAVRQLSSRTARRTAGGLLLIAAIATAATLWSRRMQSAPSPERIAVATILPTTDDRLLAIDARELTNTVSVAVAELDSAHVATREEIQRVEANAPRPLSIPSLAAALRARLIITGRIAPVGLDSMSIAMQILNQSGGQELVLRDIIVARTEVREQFSLVSERVAGGVSMLTSATFGRAMLPNRNAPRLTALRDVEEGLELEAGLRAPQANEDQALAELNRFDRAVREDNDFPQARLWFASAAARRSGGEGIASSALSIAEGFRDQLTVYERTLLDALKADIGGNHELSLRSWRVAARLAPSWPNRWWLAMKLRDVNRPWESLALFDTLARAQPSLLRWTPSVYHYVSDFDAELRALNQEVIRAPATANSLGTQQAFLQSLVALNRTGEVAKRLDEIVSLPTEAGATVAYVLTRTGWELAAHGRPTAGDDALSRAAAWCARRTSADLQDAVLSLDCVEAFAFAGRMPEMAALAEPMLKARKGDLLILGAVGLAAALHDDQTTARRFAAQIAAQTRTGGSRGLGWWLRARISAALGDRDEAIALLRDAFARGAGWSERFDLHRDPAFAKLRGYAPFESLRTPQG